MSAPSADIATPPDLIELGRVSGSYGVRGWVKVEPYSAQSSVLLQASQWWLRQGEHGPLVRWQVVQSRPQGATVVAHIQGMSQREQAAAWKGARVLVPRQAFPAPEPDEYYWVDLVGCHVYGQADPPEVLAADPASVAPEPVYLGRVLSMSDNGAHGIMHVRRMVSPQSSAPLPDSRGRDQVILVPFVSAHVLTVDLANQSIFTNWPPDV